MMSELEELFVELNRVRNTLGEVTRERDALTVSLTDKELMLAVLRGQVQSLAAERDLLREQLAEVRKDTERLDWLIQRNESIGFASGDREPSSWVATTHLRTAVDAAMLSAGQKPANETEKEPTKGEVKI